VIGGLEIAVPTFASARHAPADAGLLLAAISVGGIAGAVLYGGRAWRGEVRARLVVLLAIMTGFAAGTLAGESFGFLAVLLLCTGVAINPSLTTISLLADSNIPRRAAAEAFGWLSTGIAGGTGAGNAIAGALVRHGTDARPAFLVAAVSAGGATAVAAGLLRVRKDADG
jgi:MFS family permease